MHTEIAELIRLSARRISNLKWENLSCLEIFISLQTCGKVCPCTCHEGVLGNWVTVPLILNLGTRGDGWSSSPSWQRVRNPLGRKLGGPQSRSGRFGGKRDILPLLGIKPRILRVSVHILVTLSQRTKTPKVVVVLKHLFLKPGFCLR